MHSLPPDFEGSSNKTHGILHIKIGNLFWMNMNQNLPNSLIKLKFWGENHDGLILQPRNSTLTFASEAKYEIKVGIVNFLNYLEDMGKIKLLIFEKKTMNQIGHVLINLFLYLKRKYFIIVLSIL